MRRMRCSVLMVVLCIALLCAVAFYLLNQSLAMVEQTGDWLNEYRVTYCGWYEDCIYIVFVKGDVDKCSPYAVGSYEHLVWENEYVATLDTFVVRVDPVSMEVDVYR